MRQVLQALLRAPAGQRFLQHYQRSQRRHSAPLWLRPSFWLGVVLVMLGIVLLPMPFPTFPVWASGLCLLATQSEQMARAMDKQELWWRGLAAKWRKR